VGRNVTLKLERLLEMKLKGERDFYGPFLPFFSFTASTNVKKTALYLKKM